MAEDRNTDHSRDPTGPAREAPRQGRVTGHPQDQQPSHSGPRDLDDKSKAAAFDKVADPQQDRAGRGAGQPAQPPQTERQPTREPQTGKNESIKQSLALPRDRDESVDMTGSKANARHDPEIEQAARDVADGLKDTSRAPEMDRSYKQMSGKPDE